MWETKIKENTRQRKTITRTREYLRGSAIWLRPRNCRDFIIIREKYKVRQYSVSVSQKGEIIESSGELRYLSIIPLNLFKIAESIINFYFKKFF